MVQSTYTHPQLSHDRSIRVLHLKPGKGKQPLQCDLQEVFLDASPIYVALSYAWDSQHPTNPIECSGGIILITSNCAAAMARLRSEDVARSLWIDSICIDQNSLRERSQQVALMGDIYKSATQVVVWLGDGNPEIKIAMDYLDKISTLGTSVNAEGVEAVMSGLPGPTSSVTAHDPLRPFFERSWFYRMWTIQEVTLAAPENVLVKCGAHALPWSALITAADFLLTTLYPGESLHEAMRLQLLLRKHLLRKDPLWAGMLEIEAQVGLWVPKMINVLAQTRDKGSKDPKDKVFALFGVSKELGLALPSPDYANSVEQIYTQTAKACIEFDKDLDILMQVPNTKSTFSLPSWVPDFSQPARTSTRGQKIKSEIRRSACGPAFPKWLFTDNDQRLQLSGAVVDGIDICGDLLDLGDDFNLGTTDTDVTKDPTSEELELMCTEYKILKNWVEISLACSAKTPLNTIKENLRHTFLGGADVDIATLESFEMWYQIMTAEIGKAANQTTSSGQGYVNLHLEPLSEIGLRGAMPFHRAAIRQARQSVFFSTTQGRFGITGGCPQPGDVIAVVAGFDSPLILRQQAVGYCLSGHGYIHGIMDGELWPNEEAGLGDIVLV